MVNIPYFITHTYFAPIHFVVANLSHFPTIFSGENILSCKIIVFNCALPFYLAHITAFLSPFKSYQCQNIFTNKWKTHVLLHIIIIPLKKCFHPIVKEITIRLSERISLFCVEQFSCTPHNYNIPFLCKSSTCLVHDPCHTPKGNSFEVVIVFNFMFM